MSSQLCGRERQENMHVSARQPGPNARREVQTFPTPPHPPNMVQPFTAGEKMALRYFIAPGALENNSKSFRLQFLLLLAFCLMKLWKQGRGNPLCMDGGAWIGYKSHQGTSLLKNAHDVPCPIPKFKFLGVLQTFYESAFAWVSKLISLVCLKLQQDRAVCCS